MKQKEKKIKENVARSLAGVTLFLFASRIKSSPQLQTNRSSQTPTIDTVPVHGGEVEEKGRGGGQIMRGEQRASVTTAPKCHKVKNKREGISGSTAIFAQRSKLESFSEGALRLAAIQ